MSTFRRPVFAPAAGAAFLVACGALLAPSCASTDAGTSVDAVFDQPLVVPAAVASGTGAANGDGDGGGSRDGDGDGDEASAGEAAAPGPLEALQPADLFVAPVGDQSDAFAAPLTTLRQALYRGLPARAYSPISLEWADARLAERTSEGRISLAEAGAAIAADAILEVRLLFWDESALESDGIVGARLEARLVDPNAPDTLLWGYRIGRVVDIGELSARRATRDALVARVAEELARELLALLPERDPRRAPRDDA